MIGIVIVGFNSKKYLKSCFESIKKSSYKNFKIIFVDNFSNDDSAVYIKKNYPDIILIKNKHNYGFAKGNNIGIKKVLALKCDYVFVLNPDTILDDDCLTKLAKKANQKSILQPLILIYERGKKTNLINTTGNYLNYLGFSYCNNYRKKISKIEVIDDIPSASGAAMFIPSNIIKKVGLFDELFFMYHEDLDLCWRARIAGFNIKLISRAKVWHKYSFSKNKEKMFQAEKNRLLFIFKNFQNKTILLILPMLIINEFLLIVYSLLNKWLLFKLKTYIEIIFQIPKTVKNRILIQNHRLINDNKLKKYINSDISFSELDSALLMPYNLILKFYWFIIYRILI